MNFSKVVLLFVFIALFFFTSPIPLAAQSACTHVTFELDTTLVVNQTAVCEAAEPWRDSGTQIFIYLTDTPPANEDDWFNTLDQIEAEAGFRELGAGEDLLERSLLAFEASSGTPSGFAYTVTIGEDLFNTPLDTDASVSQLRNIMRQNIQSGEATTAFVAAIEAAAVINGLGASGALSGETDLVSSTETEATDSATGLGTIFYGLIFVLGLGGVGGVGYAVGRPILARRREEEAKREHLGQVQQSVANLLLAAEHTIDGERPEEATLYQLFKGYGGHHYEERDKTVREWLRRSQIALRDAFALRSRLIEEEQSKKPLNEQIYNWEMIYLTLVGSSPEIQNLTEEELQQLLDPFVVLEKRPEDVQLARQLDELKRKLEGQPLKVPLRQVNAAEVDQAGILGYISQIEVQISELMAAEAQAPDLLEEARNERLAAEEDVSDDLPFGMTAVQLFGGIDGRLSAIEQHIQQGLHLLAVETAVAVQRDLQIIADLQQSYDEYVEREQQIEARLAEGFRPPALDNDRRDIDTARRNIVRFVEADNYLEADDWIDELDAASLQAADNVQDWVTLHQINGQKIGALREQYQQISQTLSQEAQPAWDALQAYPAPNWDAVTSDLQKPLRALDQFGDVQIPHLEELNRLEGKQALREAERHIAASEAGLQRLEQTFRAIINRLEEVKTAEINLPNALPLAAAEHQRVVQLRDAEDSKIDAEVDAMLAEAEEKLAEAQRLHREKAFYPATILLEETRQMISQAHQSATEQVERIDTLLAELASHKAEAERQTQLAVGASNALSNFARTSATASLLSQLQQQRTTAHQQEIQSLALEDVALAEALETAVSGYATALQLAQQSIEQAEADKTTYQNLYNNAQNQIQRAESKISAARRKVNHRDAHRAGRVTLERAITTLPTRAATVSASPDALRTVLDRAKRAHDYAEDAERQADTAIRQTRQRRARQNSRPVVIAKPRPSSGGWSSGGWSSGSSSSSSRPRPRSSRRSSFGSSSRRSSFGGSSRRSSSSGRSRRR